MCGWFLKKYFQLSIHNFFTYRDRKCIEYDELPNNFVVKKFILNREIKGNSSTSIVSSNHKFMILYNSLFEQVWENSLNYPFKYLPWDFQKNHDLSWLFMLPRASMLLLHGRKCMRWKGNLIGFMEKYRFPGLAHFSVIFYGIFYENFQKIMTYHGFSCFPGPLCYCYMVENVCVGKAIW